ncbi:MAG: glycosyltransferase, partial [Bacteroidia bacterium]
FEGIKNNLKAIPLQTCFTEKAFTDEWSEADKFYLKTSVNRHYPPYFKIINTIDMFMAFGGYYEYKPIAYQPYTFWSKIKRKPYYYYAKLLKTLRKPETPAVFVFQTDNFRFWEVLYSASCPINIDFESWDLLLPVSPVNGSHYLGIHKFDFAEFSKRVEGLSKDQIEKIGAEGRKWVRENYSPKAQAQRILNNLKEI